MKRYNLGFDYSRQEKITERPTIFTMMEAPDGGYVKFKYAQASQRRGYVLAMRLLQSDLILDDEEYEAVIFFISEEYPEEKALGGGE